METRPDSPPNGRARAGDGTKKLGKRIEKVGHTAEQVWDRTRDSFSEMGDALDIKGRVNRHPYGTVAAAIGIGYVLGGGLFTPLTGSADRPALGGAAAPQAGGGGAGRGSRRRGCDGRQAGCKTNANKGR